MVVQKGKKKKDHKKLRKILLGIFIPLSFCLAGSTVLIVLAAMTKYIKFSDTSKYISHKINIVSFDFIENEQTWSTAYEIFSQNSYSVEFARSIGTTIDIRTDQQESTISFVYSIEYPGKFITFNNSSKTWRFPPNILRKTIKGKKYFIFPFNDTLQAFYAPTSDSCAQCLDALVRTQTNSFFLYFNNL